MHAQSLDNMQCRRSAKNFALSCLSPNCCISCSVNNRWNFLRFHGFFCAIYFCSGTQDVLVSWKRRSLEEWKFEVPFVYNLLSLKHFNTCSFSGHNPIYYSRRNSFISCVESVMFEKMSHLGTSIINHQLFNLFTQSRVEQIQGQFSHDEIEHLHQQVLKRKKKRVRCNDKN